MEKPLSELSRITLAEKPDPLDLMHEWLDEAKSRGAPAHLINLATSDPKGNVTNRTLVIRDIVDGALIFLSSKYGRKYPQLCENPQAAGTILLCYQSQDNQSVQRQIRIEGKIELLPKETAQVYFDRDSPHGQLRNVICKQGEKTTWEELKAKHDRTLQGIVEQKIKLSIPDFTFAFRLVPNRYDFYYAHDSTAIADRILFIRKNEWQMDRIQT